MTDKLVLMMTERNKYLHMLYDARMDEDFVSEFKKDSDMLDRLFCYNVIDGFDYQNLLSYLSHKFTANMWKLYFSK